jgi:sugar lactone lactonase YvrE
MLICLFTLLLVFSCPNALTAAEVLTIAGNGSHAWTGDGGPAAQAGIGGPFGVVIGPDGALYICETENHTVRRMDLKSNIITTVAGTGKEGYSGDGGPAVQATCREPYEVRFDSHRNMYFVEMKNHIVRKVDAKSGTISTVAGIGKMGFSGDQGSATQAQFNVPHSIALDATGTIYVADIGNHRVRAVDPKTGIIRTLSGTGKKERTPDGATLEGTPLNGPRTLDFDGHNSLLLALREGNAVYRIDLKSHTLHHVAGNGKQGYTGDGGPAKDALLSGPKGIALGPDGDIYLADTESHTIRVIRRSSGKIETLVGDGKQGDGPDGDPAKCRLNRPHGIFVDSQGHVYIGDSSNNKVRIYTPGGAK